MKKDIKWLKEEVGELNLVDTVFEADGVSYIDTAVSVMQVYDLIDELDEQEVLSQEWVRNNQERKGVHFFVNVTKLQNLIVPKQEELETKIQELIEAYKQEEDAYSNPENGWISGFIEDLKNLVEEEQKYIVSDNSSVPLLIKNDSGEIMSYDSQIAYNNSNGTIELTEQEIKNYDERFWPFAEPVE